MPPEDLLETLDGRATSTTNRIRVHNDAANGLGPAHRESAILKCAMHGPPAKPKTFFDLPREIRDDIYGHVVATQFLPGSCSPSVVVDLDRSLHVSRGYLPEGLALASKIVPSESLAVYLSRNRFIFRGLPRSNADVPRLIRAWRTPLGDHVRHLRLVQLNRYFVRDLSNPSNGSVFRTRCVVQLGSNITIRHSAINAGGPAKILFGRRPRGRHGTGTGTGGFCVCKPLRTLIDMMQEAGGYDGAVLLSFVETLLGDDGVESVAKLEDCNLCGRTKMVVRSRQ